MIGDVPPQERTSVFVSYESSGRGEVSERRFPELGIPSGDGSEEDGGFFWQLWKGYQTYGICEEHLMPYESAYDPQRFPSDAALENAQRLRGPVRCIRWIKEGDPKTGLTDGQLGIGRALYAYRLADGELPDSLERLVEVGIMPERSRHDENGNPLRARREGEWFVVQGPHWKGRWQGLDARR